MTPQKKHKELAIEVVGRVQGVTFRRFVKAQAEKIGLVGYVRNQPDGSVFIVAQGMREQLDELLELVQKGPMFAHVDGVSYFWREISTDYTGFEIKTDKGLIGDQTSSLKNLGKKLLGVKAKVPQHIAIIPDGNRRWAVSNGLAKTEGHRKPAARDNLYSLFTVAKELGVRYLTFWAFSTENWKRPGKEVKVLFDILEGLCDQLQDDAVKNKIKFRHLGRKDRLPKHIVKKLTALEESTKDYSDFYVQLCLDYGGRDEIARAVNKMLKEGVQEVHEEDIARYLDSADIPDPDLIIRTSGEQRTSGFMPYQSTYAELYFCDKHFPDFSPDDLRDAVKTFGTRKRRFGGS